MHCRLVFRLPLVSSGRSLDHLAPYYWVPYLPIVYKTLSLYQTTQMSFRLFYRESQSKILHILLQMIISLIIISFFISYGLLIISVHYSKRHLNINLNQNKTNQSRIFRMIERSFEASIYGFFRILPFLPNAGIL